MNVATFEIVRESAYQRRLSASESIDLESARIYAELTDTELGIEQIIEALASEDLRGLEALAMDAGLIASLDAEIPTDAALDFFAANPKHMGFAKKQMWFAIDEMASRMAHRRAEKMAQRLGF